MTRVVVVVEDAPAILALCRVTFQRAQEGLLSDVGLDDRPRRVRIIRYQVTVWVQPSTMAPSESCRTRGRGDSTSSRIETAIPAHPMAIPPRTPIKPASPAARSAPSG